jgi:hypothetical protein
MSTSASSCNIGGDIGGDGSRKRLKKGDDTDDLLFPNAFCSARAREWEDGEGQGGRDPRTLLELKMLQIMQAIAEKQDWQRKVHNDPTILTRWANESHVHESVVKYAIDEMLSRDIDIQVIQGCRPNSLTDLCISVVRRSLPNIDGGRLNVLPQEIVYRITTLNDSSGIKFMGLEGVYARDDIDDALRAKLCTGVEQLQAAGPPDWHPGSNEQMRDLVHPSLYPLISGVSQRVLTTRVPWSELLNGSYDSEVVNFVLPSDHDKTNEREEYSFSKKYQWLPADFDVADIGDVTINSYINNLHPRLHAELYHTIGEVFRECIPLLECCLTDLRQYNPLCVRHSDDSQTPWVYDSYQPRFSDEPDTIKDHTNKDYRASLKAWYDWQKRGTWLSSEMEAYVRCKTPPPYVKLRGRTLKVIVKLANIELTPEKPFYHGGAWHVEGMGNEAIVATAIYYHSQENVTPSTLSFREAVSEPEYEHNDHTGVRLIYGLENDDALNQELGAVNTKNGRILAFPNMFQHQVQSFELVDKQRPGHRNILVFFLCDPAAKVESSATILPLQQDWWSMESSHIPPNATTLTLDEAKVHRKELMDERKYFVEENGEKLFERECSLCEH